MKSSLLSAGVLALNIIGTPTNAQGVEEITKQTNNCINIVLDNVSDPKVKTLLQGKIDELTDELKRDGGQVSRENIYIVPSGDEFISVAVGTDDGRRWKGVLIKKD